MPDLAPANRFRRDITRLESEFVKESRRLSGEVRRDLVEVLATMGLDNLQLSLVFRRELDALKRDIRRMTADQITERLESLTAQMAAAQFELLRSVHADTPRFRPAITEATAEERRAIIDGFIANVTAWIDRLIVSLEAEIWRLRSEGEADQAQNRLLAERITDRASVWRIGQNDANRDGQRNLWTASAAILAAYYLAGERATGRVWDKQVIAAIDEKTTQTCLRAHGQIRRIKEPFVLTGTPRFADQMQHPPFHDFCRTVDVPYDKAFEALGVTTEQMTSAAGAELDARETEGRRVIHPASATSRRR